MVGLNKNMSGSSLNINVVTTPLKDKDCHGGEKYDRTKNMIGPK